MYKSSHRTIGCSEQDLRVEGKLEEEVELWVKSERRIIEQKSRGPVCIYEC